MFESHYLKPFIVSLGITIMLISGMGLSLRGIVGTGVAYDAAEVSFHLPDDSESDAKLPLLSLHLRISHRLNLRLQKGLRLRRIPL